MMAKKNDRPKEPASASAPVRQRFPIVAVGASAGGLQPFLELLEALPTSPGLAMIFVMHTNSRESGSLRDVLKRKSRMPVEIAADGDPLLVDHVYIPPPKSNLEIGQGRFRVVPREREGAPLAIDTCFRSLAEDQGNRAIGVVLSGTASDGALGSQVIKNEGGITFAQDDSADRMDMPRNAVLTGAIDFVLPPGAIARELVRIARHPYVTLSAPATFPEKDLRGIFGILRTAHEVDFTHYKPSTVERRIRRRMALARAESLNDYIGLLKSNKAEVEALYNDVLIRVTGFFRDPAVFDALSGTVVPRMLSDRAPNQPLRIWVPGCATGEEVYSIAISVLEAINNGTYSCPVQLFGTDINDHAVERARLGIYSDDIESAVSAERLRRFFVPYDGGYRVSKELRDCCIFARQNVTKDPPFSRLDLISCRNVMIYLGGVLQRKVMSIFHYALRPNGYLLLGSSETIGNFGDLFDTVDRKSKIYMKRAGLTPMRGGFDAPARRLPKESVPMEEELLPAVNLFREADRVLLTRYSPPGVLINEQMDILQFRGRTSAFLEPAPGAATLNLFKMAREGLLSELRAAIHTARKKEMPVRRDGIHVTSDRGAIVANIEVLPFRTNAGESCYIILFEEVPEPPPKAKGRGKKAEPESRQMQRFKRELESTREYLQSIIEEQEAMNEELRSANEEIQSSNEELQSTNEELETAKEELQSSNEELMTLNEELENRNGELAEANNDLINLLASVEIPIVMLDKEMRIRRLTPGAQRVLHLIPGDIGRPLSDMKMTMKMENLREIVTSVVETLETRELRAQHQDGQWYSLRVRPYKTMEGKVEGAVLVLVDVKEEKKRRRSRATAAVASR